MNDEYLVGGISLVMSAAFLAIAAGPWVRPYQLRPIQAIVTRFGKIAGRLCWLSLAMLLAVIGLAILLGLRPEYAKPISNGFLSQSTIADGALSVGGAWDAG
ncbi:MAG: hypothetical protein ISQ09_06240 [Rubripirellula sp.]|nr:hypothetical protein [Rubripirellula sp.]